MSNPAKPISNDQKKHYRTLAHGLNPIVTVAGKGLTENVLSELDRALEDHELIKIKLAITDREIRKAVIKEIAQQSHATLIQEIGKVAVFYRPAKEPKIKTTNIR